MSHFSWGAFSWDVILMELFGVMQYRVTGVFGWSGSCQEVWIARTRKSLTSSFFVHACWSILKVVDPLYLIEDWLQYFCLIDLSISKQTDVHHDGSRFVKWLGRRKGRRRRRKWVAFDSLKSIYVSPRACDQTKHFIHFWSPNTSQHHCILDCVMMFDDARVATAIYLYSTLSIPSCFNTFNLARTILLDPLSLTNGSFQTNHR